MGVKAVPIPLELWRRLAALDARCDFEIKREDANMPSERLRSRVNFDRQWHVRIWPKGEPAKAVSVYSGRALASALDGAVEIAEGMGWAVPAPAEAATDGEPHSGQGTPGSSPARA
jgi:hypothetical protein